MKLNKEVNPPVLQRMYFCLKGMRDGFIEGCRPLIGLDGCFLKGLFKGQLLAAIGRDPNDNIYPIAVAYVEVEKYDSWEWFLNLLLRDIGSHNERGWAFISDRQKGLLEAIAELAPGAEHRFCLRHMYNNFKGKFKGQELKKMFWKAASTYNVNQHLKTMAEIQNMYPKRVGEQTPYEWLAEIPPVHWADVSFQLKQDEEVHDKNSGKREGMEKYEGVVCPNIMKKTEIQRVESRNCFPSWAGEDKYENATPHDLHDFEDSKMGRVEPPDVIIKMGRPKKCRRKDANDVKETASRRGLTHTCTICMKKGHNKRSCTNPPHPNSKFNQNQDQRRQGSSTSHGASGSRRSSTPPLPPLMRMRQYNQRYLQFFPNHLRIHSPKFQLSPQLSRVAGQHQMRLQLEDLMCINHHMNRPFIQRKLLNNLSNNNIHNPQDFIRFWDV
ncbi:UNVERIFIED_CONTAM: hypothetical protein Sangu_1978900 [Sesamum angustifolium]|uniref:MULE transposase domain-containing protein n=1 Tax=Sesamum angustifolium TaxID=2727405 RepID=A0AAW2LX64_9LAMI